MSKKVTRRKRDKAEQTLLQTTVPPDLAKRFFASRQYHVHGNISAALRAILESVLPQACESQEENPGLPAMAG